MTRRVFMLTTGKIIGFVLTLLLWSWVLNTQGTPAQSLWIIIGGVLAVFPVVWMGRKLLDMQPTIDRTAWVTTIVHYALMILFGAAIIKAFQLGQHWQGWVIPLPTEIGLTLVVVTGAAMLLTVVNLALQGLGAPFALVLSQRLAINWLYAWTRNPMVLAAFAFLIALGLWLRSTLFVVWVIVLVIPAWVVFLKVYEERELELRFGAPYLEYKVNTPMLWPRKPKI